MCRRSPDPAHTPRSSSRPNIPAVALATLLGLVPIGVGCDAVPEDDPPVDPTRPDAGVDDAPDASPGDPDAGGVEPVDYDVCAGGDAPFATIQAAIDAAEDGAVIDVCAGLYVENLFIDEPVTLRAPDGARDTVIHGGGVESAVAIWSVPAPGVTIEGFTIRGGATALHGGGVRCELSTVTALGNRFVENHAEGGGGFSAEGCDLDVRDNVFDGNTAARRGGAMELRSSSGTVAGNAMVNGLAAKGGGAAVVAGSVVLQDNDVADNHATEKGGGLHLEGDAPVRGNRIDRNSCEYTGGGIYVEGHGPELSDNDVRDNTAPSDGGGVYLDISTAQLVGNRISGNYTGDDGGGVRVYVSSALLEDNIVTGNTAAFDGGGIKVSHAQSMLRGNLIADNEAGDAGGGLEMDDDASTVRRNVITGNRAVHGGGIHAAIVPWGFRIETTVIAGNTASDAGGGIELENNSAHGTLEFLVIAANEAPDGAALHVANSPATLSSSILFSNGGGSIVEVIGAAPAIRYTDIYPIGAGAFSGIADPTGGNGNISADPKFDSDYGLLTGSPCIDAGDPARADKDGTRADMGAHAGPEAL